MASQYALLLLCLTLLYTVRAGTWLSFNDFKESPLEYPIRSNIGDIVDVCNEQQRRQLKRVQHRILTRSDRENSEMCRFFVANGMNDQFVLLLLIM
ncbi:hypothetical protein KIN20_030372 [Parelaphostrongylus tenuis]|uniref:Uncharacterized protein n=1 Tax=Parelaphostrongylus tenuis TaxID=148309 RepID=A0AAD5R3P6_PARTN|nr:hypothetical protein KIN20_030372 [Parelaphostrongylus tenuis]